MTRDFPTDPDLFVLEFAVNDVSKGMTHDDAWRSTKNQTTKQSLVIVSEWSMTHDHSSSIVIVTPYMNDDPERCDLPNNSLSKTNQYENMGTFTVTVTDLVTGHETTSKGVDGLWKPRISVPHDIQITPDDGIPPACTGVCSVQITTDPQIEGRTGNKVKIVTLSARQCVKSWGCKISQLLRHEAMSNQCILFLAYAVFGIPLELKSPTVSKWANPRKSIRSMVAYHSFRHDRIHWQPGRVHCKILHPAMLISKLDRGDLVTVHRRQQFSLQLLCHIDVDVYRERNIPEDEIPIEGCKISLLQLLASMYLQ
jgi:hypothetical protein